MPNSPDSEQAVPASRPLSFPDWGLLLAIAVGTALLVPIVARAPFPGSDWILYFSKASNVANYPPWVTLLLRPLSALPPRVGLSILQALTLVAPALFAFRAARLAFPDDRQPAVMGVLLVLLSPLPWMVMWPGQIEPLPLLGLATLPFGVPFLFAKPHIATYAALGTRRDVLALAIFSVLSVFVWWMWPLGQYQVLMTGRIGLITAVGWTSTHVLIGVLGVFLLLLTTRSPWRLMAAGLLISPFVLPYHAYLLLPGLGRVRGYRQVILWAASWLTFATEGIYSPGMKFSMLLFPLLVWALLAPSLRPREILADPDILLNRAIRTARQGVDWVTRERRSQPSESA